MVSLLYASCTYVWSCSACESLEKYQLTELQAPSFQMVTPTSTVAFIWWYSLIAQMLSGRLWVWGLWGAHSGRFYFLIMTQKLQSHWQHMTCSFIQYSSLSWILKMCLPNAQFGIMVLYVFSSFMSHEKKFSTHSSIAWCFSHSSWDMQWWQFISNSHLITDY